MTDVNFDDFELLSRSDYSLALIRRLNKIGQGDRAAVTTMSFLPTEPMVAQVSEAMYGAARRGAHLTFILDANSFMTDNTMTKPGPLLYGRSYEKTKRAEFVAIRETLENLRLEGGRFAVINMPSRLFSNPFGGRSHLKFAVINDWVCVGGCNLDDNSMIDMMVAWDDAEIAKYLNRMVERMISTGSSKIALGDDDVIPVNPKADLLIDAGVAGQSLIYARALALIDSAQKSILLTCQFPPGGLTARHLLAAHRRGVEVKIIYNNPSRHIGLHKVLHHSVMAGMKLTLPQSFFMHALPNDKPFIHAKVIATETAAMIGSHNYVVTGVKLGTAEIALEVREPAFARRTAAFIADMVA
jgi:phosphatidylserine/phosphatidylglycerophosphate/cardiolipin synthase-like enzyme